MFKQLRKANQNDYLLITATLILLVVFSLSLLSYVQGQQKAAERDQAQALATGFSRTLKGEIKRRPNPVDDSEGTSFSQRWQSRQFLHSCQGPFSRKYRGQQPAAGA
ncbi:hypothetical protein ACXO8N_06375 [Lactobacillus delbrueckii subsp. bulgaricus]|nr:hypothetical protein [Lactobacillus delbrueckii subsp. bulgaricus]MBT9061807.1 hypothetical protein [Lactobacillus delbrueckii subsp. bulgaricus]MBT9063492.1 hypothetical protein [Lactobacillus delbrueckii subsp. bulgaricus]MBT9068396.1 hypothetical protein [Lactobacillus delbrueckii subsp. bulgaricus]